MTHSVSRSPATVPFRTVSLVLLATVAGLAALAVTPLGAFLLTDGGRWLLTALPAVWLAAVAAVDLRGWAGYGSARRVVTVGAWGVFALGWSSVPGSAHGALQVLLPLWLALSLAADVRAWSGYSASRRQDAALVWGVLVLAACAAWAA